MIVHKKLIAELHQTIDGLTRDLWYLQGEQAEDRRAWLYEQHQQDLVIHALATENELLKEGMMYQCSDCKDDCVARTQSPNDPACDEFNGGEEESPLLVVMEDADVDQLWTAIAKLDAEVAALTHTVNTVLAAVVRAVNEG